MIGVLTRKYGTGSLFVFCTHVLKKTIKLEREPFKKRLVYFHEFLQRYRSQAIAIASPSLNYNLKLIMAWDPKLKLENATILNGGVCFYAIIINIVLPRYGMLQFLKNFAQHRTAARYINILI